MRDISPKEFKVCNRSRNFQVGQRQASLKVRSNRRKAARVRKARR